MGQSVSQNLGFAVGESSCVPQNRTMKRPGRAPMSRNRKLGYAIILAAVAAMVVAGLLVYLEQGDTNPIPANLRDKVTLTSTGFSTHGLISGTEWRQIQD